MHTGPATMPTVQFHFPLLLLHRTLASGLQSTQLQEEIVLPSFKESFKERVCVSLYVCKRVSRHVCLHTCASMCKYVCVCVCVDLIQEG